MAKIQLVYYMANSHVTKSTLCTVQMRETPPQTQIYIYRRALIIDCVFVCDKLCYALIRHIQQSVFIVQSKHSNRV